METTITATELARNLSDILNRVRYRGESFRVVRNGEVVAVFSPPPRKRMTVREFVKFWDELPKPDAAYWDEIEEAIASLPPMPESPWES